MSSKTMLPPAALGTNKDTGAAEGNNRPGSKSHTVKVMHNYQENKNLICGSSLIKAAGWQFHRQLKQGVLH